MIFFPFVYFFIEVQLIYNVVCVSGIQQRVIYIYKSILFSDSFLYRLLLIFTIVPCVQE